MKKTMKKTVLTLSLSFYLSWGGMYAPQLLADSESKIEAGKKEEITKKEETTEIQKQYQDLLQLKEQAAKAYQAKNLDQAQKAAREARKIQKSLLPSSSQFKEMDQLVREIRNYAGLIQDEEKLKNNLGGWVASSYGYTRQLLVGGLFQSLIFVTEKAEGKGYDLLSGQEKEIADMAKQLASVLGTTYFLPEGELDWKSMSNDLKKMSKNPPSELPLFLASNYFFMGQMRLGLFEMERVDSEKITDPQIREVSYLLRGSFYRLNDLPYLSTQEFEKIEMAPQEEGRLLEREWLAGIHLLKSGTSLYDTDLDKADQELKNAIQIWPENPLIPLLKGEFFLARGEHKKAADSMIQGIVEGMDPWFVEQIQDRAVEIREKEGKVDKLFVRVGFVRDVFTHYVDDSSKRSQYAQELQVYIGMVQNFVKMNRIGEETFEGEER